MSDSTLSLFSLIWVLIELATPIIIVFLIVYFVKKGNRARAEKKAADEALVTPLNPSDPTCKALVDEAFTVINDMLEVGLSACEFSDGEYEGHIFWLMTHKANCGPNLCEYNITIYMGRLGDLRGCRDKPYFQRLRQVNPEYVMLTDKLDSFLAKYANCYDPSDRQYVYHTRATIVRPHSSADDGPFFHDILRKQLEAHCPLADFSGVGLHTKNVAH